MITLLELSEIPLAELTGRVHEAKTPEEKVHEFANWLLRVNGIDGIHGLDAINEVMSSEFGPGSSLTVAQLDTFKRYCGAHYIIKKDEIYTSAA